MSLDLNSKIILSIVTFRQVAKQHLGKEQTGPVPFYQRILIAGFAGACGGFIGTPGDMVNVRMQNDIKLPPGSRRK